jgi:hypothetical protein
MPCPAINWCSSGEKATLVESRVICVPRAILCGLLQMANLMLSPLQIPSLASGVIPFALRGLLIRSACHTSGNRKLRIQAVEYRAKLKHGHAGLLQNLPV